MIPNQASETIDVDVEEQQSLFPELPMIELEQVRSGGYASRPDRPKAVGPPFDVKTI
jgi:hypothetical protein